MGFFYRQAVCQPYNHGIMANKFVLVPPTFMVHDGKMTLNYSSVDLVNKNEIMFVNINGTNHQVIRNNNYSTPGSLVYDPMNDHLEWYGLIAYATPRIYVTPEDINHKLWSQRELLNWINENLEDEVLVQRNPSMWVLACVNQNDFQKFNKWWNSLVKKHNFCVKTNPEVTPYQLDEQVTQWCKENCTVYKVVRNYDSVVVYIKDDEEAVQFKLTWMDPR